MPVTTLATFRWRLSLLSSIDFPYLLSTLAGEENRVGGEERELIRWPGLTHGRKPSCQGSLLHQIKEPLALVLFWIIKPVQLAQDTQITEEAVILNQQLFSWQGWKTGGRTGGGIKECFQIHNDICDQPLKINKQSWHLEINILQKWEVSNYLFTFIVVVLQAFPYRITW